MLATLSRGLEAVEILSEGPGSVRQVADSLGVGRQIAYRLLTTLCECGWAERDPRSNTYRLTARAWSIARRSFDVSDLRATWSPVVRRLAAHGETIHLAVYDAGEAVYIDKAEGTNPVRAYSRLGGRTPAHCVATGKVLLAFLEAVDLDRVLSGPLISATESTIVDRRRLRRHLGSVRARGYAVNLGEWRQGVGGIAVPIRSETGQVVAALGLSASLDRLEHNLETHLELLRHEADAGTVTNVQ